MQTEKPLVNSDYLLKKFSGKGGWTYAEIPEILQDKSKPFGWVQVKGTIDGFELKQYKLMPNGNGQLFLPVKAAIRKKIKKEAGDRVKVVLYPDHSEFEIPLYILDCFSNESPGVQQTFNGFTNWERKAYIDWIEQAKREETKIRRITTMMDRLSRNLKYHDRE